MEKDKEHDLIRRKESSAPNLTPVDYYEGSDFICCSEILQKSKPKLCEGLPNPPPVRHYQCLSKTKPLSKPCKWSRESNERDILFRPIRWRCKAPMKRDIKNPEPSLGAPIGLAKSSFGMKFLESKSSDQVLQGFATNLLAFAEYFITPEIEWDENVINRILLEGQYLYADSKAKLHDGEKLKEASINRSFTLCGNTFDLLVNDAFMVGQIIGQEAAVPNLHWGLLKFFKKFQFCLLQIENWYTMLWRNADVYFLFDCFGRRCLDLQSDRKHGVAILICLRHIENVSHLILNLSDVSPEDFFIIRNMKVKSLVPCGGEPTPDIVDRSVEFDVINNDYAILKATIHLGSYCFKEIRFRHSLPVALCALIHAKIDATPTWNRAILDKIIKLGAHFYKQWTHCDVSVDLGIQDVPNRFVFGQFMVQIAVNDNASGIWKCTPNYHNSELSQTLGNAFRSCSNLLVRIAGRTYPIWKKGAFFYVLDPYSHRCSIEKKKIVTASLHMCGSFAKMCCIFTQALLELFEESKFIVSLVKIIKLEEFDKIKENLDRSQVPCTCAATPQIDGDQEVISLNESVFVVDGYACQAEQIPVESDSADLDSLGLSQTRLEDYTAMRREFIEESDEETEEDEDDDIDLNSGSDIGPSDKFDESDDEGSSSEQAKEKKTTKKTTKLSKGSSEKKNRKGKAESDLSDAVETHKRSKKKKEDKKKEDKKKHEKKNKPETKKKDKGKNIDGEKQEESEKPRQEKEAPGKDRIPREEKDITNQFEHEKPIENNEVIEEVRSDTPESEPVDQDSPSDQRKSKGDTPTDRGSTEVPKTSTAPTRRLRHQRRKQQDGDDSSSSDEIPRGGIPVGCIPNSYPGFTEDPQNLAVIGSESGSYESLCNLLKTAFRCSDRILTMTPWGNYVAFRSNGTYFVFDGCTCNLRSIRHMDLSVGTAGLLCFRDLHSLIQYIEGGRGVRRPTTFSKRNIIDQICSKYCSN